MVKRLVLAALRLLTLNIVAAILTMFFMGIENVAVMIGIECLLALMLWIFVWLESSGRSQNDVKKDKITRKRMEDPAQTDVDPLQYKPWFGFVSGLLAQLPNIAAIVVYFTVDEALRVSTITPIVNVMNINYVIISNQLNFFPYLYVLFSLAFIVVSGLGYLSGPAQQRRLETIIERNKARKAKRVQDDLKNKKKGVKQKESKLRR